MFPSWGRGAETSAPPAQDAFREVFQSHLQARLKSQDNALRDAASRPSRLGSSRALHHQGGLGAGRAAAAGANSGELHHISLSRGRKTQGQERRTTQKSASPNSGATPATDQGQAVSQPGSNQNGPAAAAPPQALRDFMAFLQSLPGGSFKIPPEQVPAVSSFLVSAGLPQAEVDRLLSTSGSQEVSLSAADLEAAWQGVQGQGMARGIGLGLNQPQVAAPQSQTGPNQPQAGPSQSQPAQDIRQTQDYRTLWERLSLPQSLVPTVRLALARLGASPEALTQLEGTGQGGQGIPLTRVWQMLQNVKNGPGPQETGSQNGTAPAASPTPAALAGQQPVTGAETEEWRQMLLQAGLPPEVVDQLLGQVSAGTQEQLKTRLLSMAPADEGPLVLDNPKPLYLPANLRMRPFFWQGQTGQEQPQGEAQLDGNGGETKGQAPASQLAALAAAPSPAEAFSLPSFPAQLQGLSHGLPNPGAPLGDTGPAWRPFSPEIQESLWTQLQSGVISNLGQGESQVTISLNPPDLGQIQLSLQLNGQELAVTAVASRPEVAEMANLGMPQLIQALAQQGLVLSQFQVHVQDQPTGQIAPMAAAPRAKGSEPGGSSSTSSRRRSGEVDRFA